MLKSQRNTVFYKSVDGVTEIRRGYFVKSPPHTQMTSLRSWKKRFFVLFKISEDEHQLKYFRSEEEMEESLGGINLSQISQLQVNPENHTRWAWIQKNFKCQPDCVLYIKALRRDYFLIKDEGDVWEWFIDIDGAMRIKQTEDMTGAKVISYPLSRQKTVVADKPFAPRVYSRSDPTVTTSDDEIQKPKLEDHSRRRASHPMNPIYDVPRSYLRKENVTNDARQDKVKRIESEYEIMSGMKDNEEPQLQREEDSEDEGACASTLLVSVNQVFDKHKTQSLPRLDTETEADDRHQTSDFSSGSSDGASSPVEMQEKRISTDSLDSPSPAERNIEVKQAELKKHLTVTEVDGKPCVSGWTGQLQNLCLFRKGDRILAINDLHTSSVEEFNMYVSRLLRDELKVTILRQPGSLPPPPPLPDRHHDDQPLTDHQG